MKITVEQLRTMVKTAINEAKKKKEKDVKEDLRPDGCMVDKNMDYAPPLGGTNLYRSQGAANFGSYTNTSKNIDDRATGTKVESTLRQIVGKMISEELRPDPRSAWARLVPEEKNVDVPRNIWEAALHYYDFQRRGLGQVKEDASASPPNVSVVHEKDIGFKKLKNKFAHKKGVKDPGALAASIGRRKYGASGMAKKAAAGRK